MSSQQSPSRPSVSSFPLSADLLINAHTNASDPKLAALEQAISERNSLSAQNTQLWRLLEKQKAGYNQILKELDRIRAERDSYKAKLGIGTSSAKRDWSNRHGFMQHSDNSFSTDTVSSVLGKPSLVAPPRLDSLSSLLQSPSTSSSQMLANSSNAMGSPYLSANELKTHAIHQSVASKLTAENTTSSALSATLSPTSHQNHSSESRAYLRDPLVPFNQPDTSTHSPMETGSTTSLVGSSSIASSEPRQTEFLEMDEEESEEVRDSDGAVGSGEPDDSAFSTDAPSPADVISARPEQSPQRMRTLDVTDVPPSTPRAHQSDGGKSRSHTVVDDFPLPPSNIHLHPLRISTTHSPSSSQIHGSQPLKHHDIVEQSPLRSQPNLPQAHQSQTADAPNSNSKSQAVVTHFRALPLLSSDLPTTTISVSHSFIRPNDKGKEVLSFIVYVSPGNGKSGWKIEKLYSDVLGLDQRVRQSVGKGIGKKIATLPEGKLWKDHAPAKVDQRKAILEHYLQTLINLPVKNNDEVIAFFTTDIVRETKQPVMQAGYKEGYLTKRGKNFGGWKTRYFVLQGPVLEYYDCRGGTHLGSILITGAQIGRQQRTDRTGSDEDKEYRHAFLIVEAKKGPGGHHPRHVLCAESDEERDSWVEMLVRYFTGTYTDDPLPMNALPNAGQSLLQLSMSTATIDENSGQDSSRGFFRDDISFAKMHTTQPACVNLDDSTRDRSSSPTKSLECSLGENDDVQAQEYREISGTRASEPPLDLPASLPEQSMLSLATSALISDTVSTSSASLAPRANSELGHYPDLQSPGMANLLRSRRSPEKHHKSVYPPTAVSSHGHNDRIPSPDKLDSASRKKISAPINGAPIPSGFKFGGHADVATPPSDRREKAKSRSFWGFGKTNGDKQVTVNVTRAVFGVALEESLDVAQICNLPAIAFRAIQYLEAKEADQEEGIYRLSGSSAVIKSLKDRFNAEGDVDLLASDEYWDPHAIAGLLKSFLRELPASILTRELHLQFLAVIDFVDAQERIRELTQLIAALPLPNYTLLRALTAHLILIVQNSAVNKMTMRNVGIVFSPTLGIPAGVFSLMLGEFNRVFNVDGETNDGGSVDGPSELCRRNSRRYSEAAADELLGLSGRTLKVNDDSQSEGDDVLQDGESEATDGEMTLETFSSNTSPHAEQSFDTAPETPTKHKVSKALHAASSRGLSVNVSQTERDNRRSRMMGGLPASPRPPPSPHQNGDSRKGSS